MLISSYSDIYANCNHSKETLNINNHVLQTIVRRS